MNLYVPNPQLDSPFGYADLEWLYRQQDVDGSSLVSRLAQLAPISFSNTVDGQRRRRLFALDSWETNNFVWANDNPPSTIASRPGSSPTTAASHRSRTRSFLPNSAAPTSAFFPPTASQPAVAARPADSSLAHRDKKINLNYPLPVSNDPNEAVRQKWISDTYQTLKAILPPLAVDTPEELAQLSQFVINIIDFRDTDGTMTHWRNPDVFLRTGTAALPAPPVPGAGGRLQCDDRRPARPVRHGVQPDRHQRGDGLLVPEHGRARRVRRPGS